jgi:hypothetical protein
MGIQKDIRTKGKHEDEVAKTCIQKGAHLHPTQALAIEDHG